MILLVLIISPLVPVLPPPPPSTPRPSYTPSPASLPTLCSCLSELKWCLHSVYGHPPPSSLTPSSFCSPPLPFFTSASETAAKRFFHKTKASNGTKGRRKQRGDNGGAAEPTAACICDDDCLTAAHTHAQLVVRCSIPNLAWGGTTVLRDY